MTTMDIKQIVKDRDEAFIDFVKNGDMTKVRLYCMRYGVTMPADPKIFKAGIYKAVQECTDIPEDIKEKARRKCIKLGFKPTIEGVTE